MNGQAVVARERIDGALINATCNSRGELILNVAGHAWHMTPATARRIQRALAAARFDHACRYGEDVDE